MAELATLARPYANAVFAVAKGDSTLERWSRMFAYLTTAAADPRVKSLLDSPEVGDEQKALRLAEICGDELNDRARKFVQVLAQNKRLDIIAEIQGQFEALRAAEEQTLDVEVISAYPLSDAESANLRRALAEKYAKEVNLTSVVDSSLIGGAIIRAGDTVIDGSLRGKLNKLAETLQRN
jgi:F-type H+-transporting ATPase subunit delta